jgi:hypothetical protein
MMCITLLMNAFIVFIGFKRLQSTVLNLQLIVEVIEESIDIPVVFKTISENVGGYYDPDEGYIVLNLCFLGKVRLIDLLYHEWRHRQQHMKNSSFMDGYIPMAVCYQSYMLQHIEVDARRYGYVMLSKLLRKHKRYVANFRFKVTCHPFTGSRYKKIRRA